MQNKGLCFRWDEKFGPELDGPEQGLNTAEDVEESLKNLHVSMYSIIGLTSKKSIKLWGKIARNKGNCRASNSFISSKLVQEKGIQVTAMPPYTVELCDGRKIRCE
jgi:hypothetical protein